MSSRLRKLIRLSPHRPGLHPVIRQLLSDSPGVSQLSAEAKIRRVISRAASSRRPSLLPRTLLASLFVLCIPGIRFNEATQMHAAENRPDHTAPASRPASPVSQADVVDIPIVIAHRGASGYLPEHTTEGVAMSHAMGADYIEQDVILTKDAVPIVLHDLCLDDVTDVADVFPGRQQADGKYYAMDFLLSEIRQLTLNERCSPSRAWKNSGTRYPIRKSHFRIGTLSEHIELIQGMNQSRRKNAGLYVEIKDPVKHHQAGLDSAKAILAVLTQYGYTDPDHHIFLQCFDPREVHRVRTELDCRLPIIQLLTEIPDAESLRQYSGVSDGLGVPLQAVVSGVNPDGTPVVTSLVSDAKALAMQVHVWTFRTDALPDFAPNPDTMISWLVRDGGVDGIFSDQPDVVLAWRAGQHDPKPIPAGIRLIQN